MYDVAEFLNEWLKTGDGNRLALPVLVALKLASFLEIVHNCCQPFDYIFGRTNLILKIDNHSFIVIGCE